MLFDLRGAGRRRAVKMVYLALAFLMFAGFVGFSVGSNVSGGIIDAITQRNQSGSSATTLKRFQARVNRAQQQARENPKDAAAWATLARAHFQLAGLGDNYDTTQNTFTASGRAELRRSSAAWQRYLTLHPERPDATVAGVMVQVY